MAKATYLFITLLLVVGTQIASSKSVGEEIVKDGSKHLVSKRQTEDNAEEEQAAQEEEEVVTTTEAEDYTTPIGFIEDTTTINPDTEEDAVTVKPLGEDNNANKLDTVNKKEDKQVKDPKRPKPKPQLKPPSKPQLLPDLLNRGGEPSTNLLPPAPFSCIPPSYFGQSPPLAQFPAAFAQPQHQQPHVAPWAYSFLLPPPLPEYLPPMVAGPTGYDYPHPSGPAFSAPGGFASASAGASANGQGGSVSTSTSPGGNVQTSFGIGNRGGFPTAGGQQSGPFPAGGGVVSQSASSHSSSGPNGQQFSSSVSSNGPDGVQSSFSHSGPNGVQQGNYGAPSFPGGNFGPQQVANGPFPHNIHSSGSFVSASGTIPPGGQPSFISIRGSFPGDDGESVAIEVDGPEGTRVSVPEGAQISGPSAGGPPSGVPQYSGPNYAYSGPGYASSGAYSPGYYGPAAGYSPYAGGNSPDINGVFQQYFAQLQAQQEAFQRQIQAQIAAQQQAGGTFASGGAFMTNRFGQVDPNAQYYVKTYSSPNHASSATSIDSRFGFGGTKSSAFASPYQNKNKKNSIWDQSNQVDSRFGGSNEPASAYSSINVGPQGGYQQGAINPARPGIFSRFGEDVPAPSGNSYGVFSSSSSSSSTGPDGKTITQKSASVGVNDNGKISVKTVHDP